MLYKNLGRVCDLTGCRNLALQTATDTIRSLRPFARSPRLMRGGDRQTAAMLSYLSPEDFVPPNRPLRAIRPLVNAALDRLSADFARIYSVFGWESIAPEKLLQ